MDDRGTGQPAPVPRRSWRSAGDIPAAPGEHPGGGLVSVRRSGSFARGRHVLVRRRGAHPGPAARRGDRPDDAPDLERQPPVANGHPSDRDRQRGQPAGHGRGQRRRSRRASDDPARPGPAGRPGRRQRGSPGPGQGTQGDAPGQPHDDPLPGGHLAGRRRPDRPRRIAQPAGRPAVGPGPAPDRDRAPAGRGVHRQDRHRQRDQGQRQPIGHRPGHAQPVAHSQPEPDGRAQRHAQRPAPARARSRWPTRRSGAWACTTRPVRATPRRRSASMSTAPG